MALVLYIEPLNGKSQKPVHDKYTKVMSNHLLAAIDQYHKKMDSRLFDENPKALWGIGHDSGEFTPEMATMGIHTCICGATSTSYDIKLPKGYITNSLANHYLMWHRDEVPVADLQKLDIAFGFTENHVQKGQETVSREI